jgi:5-methylcytosine-specific restriction endonuclease McrA
MPRIQTIEHTEHERCLWCRTTFREVGHKRRSWSFGLVCEDCSHKAGRTTQRQNKRCLKKSRVKGRLSKFDWLSVLYKHDFSCASCKSSKELTLDHKVKLCEGGVNSYWNIQPLCVSCHRIKDDN